MNRDHEPVSDDEVKKVISERGKFAIGRGLFVTASVLSGLVALMLYLLAMSSSFLGRFLFFSRVPVAGGSICGRDLT